MSARARYVTVVSGLPRSGTSMLMNMLSAGGLELLVDGVRAADADNPRGYFELEAVKSLARDHAWLAGALAKAVKIVSLHLRHLPRHLRYRVIFMERRLEDVLRSQRAMLQRRGEDAGPDDAEVREAFEKHVSEVVDWLRGAPNLEVLFVRYDDAVDRPLEHAARVNDFLDGRLDVEAMARAVDPSLRRSRRG